MNEHNSISSIRKVDVLLTDEELAAVEGWRKANAIHSSSEAVRELLRLGLLSEIGRIYRAAVKGR